MMRSYISLVLIVVWCMPAMADNALPNWVQNPPLDTGQWIYGIGNGATVPQAQQDALKNIAGKLMTDVKAHSKSSGFINNGLSTQSFKQDIQTYVDDTNLTDYQTVKTVSYENGFFSLVRMSRTGFIASTRLRLKQLDQAIKSHIQEAKHMDKLRRFVVYRQMRPSISMLRELSLLLQSADSNFDASQYLTECVNLKSQIDNLTGNIRLIIRSSPDLRPLISEVSRILSEDGINATNHEPADGLIEITGTAQQHEIFGTTEVVVTVVMETVDVDGTILKRHSYSLSGNSVTDYTAAISDAVSKFDQRYSSQVLKDIGLG